MRRLGAPLKDAWKQRLSPAAQPHNVDIVMMMQGHGHGTAEPGARSPEPEETRLSSLHVGGHDVARLSRADVLRHPRAVVLAEERGHLIRWAAVGDSDAAAPSLERAVQRLQVGPRDEAQGTRRGVRRLEVQSHLDAVTILRRVRAVVLPRRLPWLQS